MTAPLQANTPDVRHTIETFWQTFPPLWHVIRAHIRQVAVEQFGITVEQFHALRHIRMGLTSVSEIAGAKCISRAAISQSIDLLVDRGLVARAYDAQDRRRIQLTLTPSGNDLLDAVFDNTHRWMAELFAPLSDEELQILSQAMESLRKVLPA